MRKFTILFLIIAFLMLACQLSERAIQTAPAPTHAAISASPSINTPDNSAPTIPFTPTITPTPTNPSLPEPLTFTGTGNSIIDVSAKWDGPAVLHIVAPAEYDVFVVNGYDDAGEMRLLTYSGYAYDGRVPIEFGERDMHVVKLEIIASGEWTITILPFSEKYIDTIEVPGIFEGHEENVILVKGNASTITAKCNRNVDFYVESYSSSEGWDAPIFEISGPYEGTAALPINTYMLEITGKCDWSIELK